MTSDTFQSVLAQRLADFIEYKRLQNYTYREQEQRLHLFDTFLLQVNWNDRILTRSLVDGFIQFIKDKKTHTRYGYISLVAQFSRYLHLYEPQSYVIDEIPVSRPSPKRYYIFSRNDIRALMENCQSLTPTQSIKPHAYRTLFGLLYCTGLRISEALSLNIADIYNKKSLLFVRKGKFNKDRWIPLAASTTQALTNYMITRQRAEPRDSKAPLFINHRARRINYYQAQWTFRKLITQCHIVNHQSEQSIRLHDLRHTYATNCLLTWYENGDDINANLPILATAMGHVNIASTQVYLHNTEQIRAYAHERFYAHFQHITTNKGDDND